MAKKSNPQRLELLDKAVRAIEAVADDESVSQEVSIADLETLSSVADGCIEGLRDDIKNREAK